MSTKMYHMSLGFLFSGFNIYLIDTRFTIVGIGFGCAAIVHFITALRTKP